MTKPKFEQRRDIIDILPATQLGKASTADADDTPPSDKQASDWYWRCEQSMREHRSAQFYEKLWGQPRPKPQTFRERMGINPIDTTEPTSVREHIFGKTKTT